MPGDAPGDRRLVVVSPHLDDAVLSLGAWIAQTARRGTQVVVLTVLACDPDSTATATGWDARGGFATEAEAARARRDEDAAACAELGAVPVWLPFGSVDYERHGDEDDVRSRVSELLDEADSVLLPGSPLTHPDHEWLVRTLLGAGLPCRELVLYAEQPYSARDGAAGAAPTAPDWLRELLDAEIAFERRRAAPRDWLAKRRALRRYRSQLPLLALAGRPGLPLERHLLAEARAGGEALARLPPAATGLRPRTGVP